MQGSEAAATVRATVKWFNGVKGFGFVTPVDGTAEAFLHLSALKQAGYETVSEGADMLVEIGQSPKGRQVVRVIQVDQSQAMPARAPMGRPPRPAYGGGGGGYGGGPSAHTPLDTSNAESIDGVVKWFSPHKGYGFVSPNGGGKDVFLHITVLRNAGLMDLSPGQSVRMQVVTARKGPEAVSIQVVSPIGPGADL